ncbi:MAG: response regulator transcription factor [Rhodobacter sp.]|nr:response regulator transcription factor [Rhodobacter sp.]
MFQPSPVVPVRSGVNDTEANERDLVAFAGPKKRFTNTLMRNIEEEFDDVSPVRFETIEEYLDSIKSNPVSTRVLIVDPVLCKADDRQCYEFAKRYQDIYQGDEPPGIVIAYWDVESAQELCEQLDGHLDLRGFIPMNQSIDIWLGVLRLLVNGGVYYAPDVLGVDPKHPLQGSEPVAATNSDGHLDLALGKLTRRETDVVELLSNGLQNKQIAAELGVSEHTIKLHIHHIITKMGVHNRTEAAMKFMQMKGD